MVHVQMQVPVDATAGSYLQASVNRNGKDYHFFFVVPPGAVPGETVLTVPVPIPAAAAVAQAAAAAAWPSQFGRAAAAAAAAAVAQAAAAAACPSQTKKQQKQKTQQVQVTEPALSATAMEAQERRECVFAQLEHLLTAPAAEPAAVSAAHPAADDDAKDDADEFGDIELAGALARGDPGSNATLNSLLSSLASSCD